jgi:thiamine-phosphate pyrophosphorylase
LCAICDADACTQAGWLPTDAARAFLEGGARFIQLRAKRLSGDRLLDLARTLADMCHDANALLVVNDRADIARLATADGVHLGQDDLPARAVRQIMGDGAIVGLSTHTAEQLDAALVQPVSYVAIGPVFVTTTKATGYQAVGLDGVRQAAASADRPLVAIGGITLETAPSVIDAGATSVAVISDLLSTGDPASRVRAYIERLDAGRSACGAVAP